MVLRTKTLNPEIMFKTKTSDSDKTCCKTGITSTIPTQTQSHPPEAMVHDTGL